MTTKGGVLDSFTLKKQLPPEAPGQFKLIVEGERGVAPHRALFRTRSPLLHGAEGALGLRGWKDRRGHRGVTRLCGAGPVHGDGDGLGWNHEPQLHRASHCLGAWEHGNTDDADARTDGSGSPTAREPRDPIARGDMGRAIRRRVRHSPGGSLPAVRSAGAGRAPATPSALNRGTVLPSSSRASPWQQCPGLPPGASPRLPRGCRDAMGACIAGPPSQGPGARHETTPPSSLEEVLLEEARLEVHKASWPEVLEGRRREGVSRHVRVPGLAPAARGPGPPGLPGGLRPGEPRGPAGRPGARLHPAPQDATSTRPSGAPSPSASTRCCAASAPWTILLSHARPALRATPTTRQDVLRLAASPRASTASPRSAWPLDSSPERCGRRHPGCAARRPPRAGGPPAGPALPHRRLPAGLPGAESSARRSEKRPSAPPRR